MPRQHNQGAIHVWDGPRRFGSVATASGPVAPSWVRNIAKVAGTTSASYLPAPLSNYGTVQAGSLLLLVIETANQALTVDAAWTQLASSPQGTGTGGAADATSLNVYYHFWDGITDPPSTVTGSDHQIGTIAVFDGVDPVAPINAIAGTTDATADTTIDWPSVTTTADKCLVLLIEAHALPDTNTNEQTSGQTNANLTGLAEVTDFNTASGNGGGISIAAGVMETAGVVGASTGTAAVATKKGLITLALAPIPVA